MSVEAPDAPEALPGEPPLPPVPEGAVMVTLKIARFNPDIPMRSPKPLAGRAFGFPACPATGC